MHFPRNGTLFYHFEIRKKKQKNSKQSVHLRGKLSKLVLKMHVPRKGTRFFTIWKSET